MLQCFRFVSINCKGGIELCKLEYVAGCLCRRNQSHGAASAANRCPRRDDLGDTPAAEVRKSARFIKKCCRPSSRKVFTECRSESSPISNLPATSSITTSETIRNLMVTDIRSSYC